MRHVSERIMWSLLEWSGMDTFPTGLGWSTCKYVSGAFHWNHCSSRFKFLLSLVSCLLLQGEFWCILLLYYYFYCFISTIVCFVHLNALYDTFLVIWPIQCKEMSLLFPCETSWVTTIWPDISIHSLLSFLFALVSLLSSELQLMCVHRFSSLQISQR